MRNVAILVLSIVAFTAAMEGAFAQTQDDVAVLVSGTGSYDRPISTDSEEAQRFFSQGIRLTWAYYFPEALASFRQAARFDPTNPMIHWGAALAIGPNPNSRHAGRQDDPAGEGLKAIRTALALMNDETSAQERMLIEALQVRYDTETYPDRSERDRAYLGRTRQLMDRYPNDPDAVALFADAFMTMNAWEYWEENGDPRPGTVEVSRALEDSMRRMPDHPGTHHLYVHLHEASLHPEIALPVADRLDTLMPNAGHIVHMPSHIYIRVGQYAEAVAQNRRSVAADERFLDAWGDRPLQFVTSLPMSAVLHAWHAYDFWRYAAMQMGHYGQSIEAAEAMLETARRFSGDGPCAAEEPTVSLWFVERTFGRWEELLGRLGDEPADECVLLKGMWHYMRGSALAGLDERRAAEQELVRLLGLGESTEDGVRFSEGALGVAAASLKGQISQLAGELSDAVSAYRDAVNLEDQLPYAEPPTWPLPNRRLLGAALIAAERGGEAEEVYRRDLLWNQNNGWSLFGLWQSLLLRGKAVEAERARERFESAWRDADVVLTVSGF